jgi:hypothetical protein
MAHLGSREGVIGQLNTATAEMEAAVVDLITF